MNIEAFVAAFKTELRKHGEMYHYEAVDNAIRAAVAAGAATQEPVADNGDLAKALIARAVDPTVNIVDDPETRIIAEGEVGDVVADSKVGERAQEYTAALNVAEPGPSEFEE